MTISAGSLLRPAIEADHSIESSHRKFGMVLIVMGLMVAMAAFVSSIALASVITTAEQGAWIFGVATAALGTIKSGIALILWGIVRRIWFRVESIKAALPDLMPQDRVAGDVTDGPVSTRYGAGRTTESAPEPMLIHRMAIKLWAPMLVMGAMLVMVGLILSVLEATAADNNQDTFQALRALAPGIEFFGEALLLAGISFLLASILASLRQGGGEVQESVGAGVKTLLMPLTAKLFLALMIMGMMVSMLQLVLYIVVATLDSATAAELQTINAWHAWLGPLREAGLGLLLSGIVLALVTIGTVLGFQFHRIRELIATGR
jgi:hypothetical protein